MKAGEGAPIVNLVTLALTEEDADRLWLCVRFARKTLEGDSDGAVAADEIRSLETYLAKAEQ